VAGEGARADGVTHMWLDIAIAVVLAAGIYCVAVLVGFQTRMLTRKSNRRAEDLYGQYADSPRRQRKIAGEHGGTWQDSPR
jgi:hypothetical protein